jgi:hypothetical protein
MLKWNFTQEVIHINCIIQYIVIGWIGKVDQQH